MTLEILTKITQIFPKLSQKSTKGNNGRIAVIGGSYEFSGAPYYTAISALKVGGDLGHIFCNKSASSSIKSYSPQIIVHPVFISNEQICLSENNRKQLQKVWIQKINTWQQAVNCWVIGPGLGRDLYMCQFFPTLIRSLPEDAIVVFDADGIYHLCQHPYLFDELNRFKTILSTNKRQEEVLLKFLGVNYDIIQKQFKNKKNYMNRIDSFDQSQEIIQLEFNRKDLFNKRVDFSIILKGQSDFVLGPNKSFVINLQGGRKRCGGIGDIFAGIIAMCSYWDYDLGPVLASKILKQTTSLAYQKYGRSLTAPLIIQELSGVVKKLQKRSQNLV